MGLGSDDKKKDFNLIVNVLTKIYFIFGQQPFIDRSLHHPLFLYTNQIWFQQINNEQNQHNISFVLNGWTSIIIQWLKLGHPNRRQYTKQINPDLHVMMIRLFFPIYLFIYYY
jgi:hypothetical protein